MTEAPSPNHVTATRFSPRILKARAWPTAIGTIAPMWLTIATMPRLGSAKCTLASRPRAGPSTRPMYCARIRHGSSPRTMCTRHVPLRRRRDVLWTKSQPGADRGALVPAARVEAAGDLALLVEEQAPLLDAAVQQHVAEHVDQLGPREPDVRERARRVRLVGESHGHRAYLDPAVRLTTTDFSSV